jgi:hypothetical protein
MTVTNSAGSPNTCATDVTVASGYAPPTGCISVNINNPGCQAPIVRSASVAKNKAPGATLYWTVNDVSSCALTYAATGASVPGAPTNGQNILGFSTGALANRTEYVLTCTGNRPGTSFTDRAVINILPTFREI